MTGEGQERRETAKEAFDGRDNKEEKVAAGQRTETRDRAMARFDEKEIKARMIEAFDRYITMGFEVQMIGVESRGAVLYKIVLTDDGDVPLRQIQSVADELRMDIFVEKGMGLAMYARV